MDGNMQKLKEQEESELCMYAQIKRFSTKDCHLTLFQKIHSKVDSSTLCFPHSLSFNRFIRPFLSPHLFSFLFFISAFLFLLVDPFFLLSFLYSPPSVSLSFLFFFLTLPTSSTTFNNYIQRLVEEFCFNYQLHPTSFKSQPSTCIKSASFCPLSTYPFLSSFFSERVKRKKKKKEKTSQHCQ